MKLAKLIASVEWAEVKEELLLSYPDAKRSVEGYQLAFSTLQKLDANEADMRLIVRETFQEEFDESPYTEVTGRNGTLNKELGDFKYLEESVDSEYANAETEYALSLTPWEQWLGMELDKESLNNYTAPQIVVHCLREMTFHGFKQSQIQEERDELQRRIDELDAMTEEEKKEHLIPWEEVKKELEKKLSS